MQGNAAPFFYSVESLCRTHSYFFPMGYNVLLSAPISSFILLCGWQNRTEQMTKMSVPGRGTNQPKHMKDPVRTFRHFLLPCFIDHGDHNFKYYCTFYLGFPSDLIEMAPGQCWTFEWKSQPPFFWSNDTLRLTSQSNTNSFIVTNTVQTLRNHLQNSLVLLKSCVLIFLVFGLTMTNRRYRNLPFPKNNGQKNCLSKTESPWKEAH